MGADDRRAACDVPRKQNMTSIIKYGFDDISDIPSVGASKGVSLEDSEKEAVIAALARNNGKKKPAADELGISLRTLYRKIREFGIDDSESAG